MSLRTIRPGEQRDDMSGAVLADGQHRLARSDSAPTQQPRAPGCQCGSTTNNQSPTTATASGRSRTDRSNTCSSGLIVGDGRPVPSVIVPPYSYRFSDARPNHAKSNIRPIRSASADPVETRGLVDPARRGD